MTMPTDKEERDILRWREERRSFTTTDRINKSLSQAEQRILQQVAEVWQEVMTDRKKINEHEGFISKIRRAFNGVVK
jgi:hypothetical protein